MLSYDIENPTRAKALPVVGRLMTVLQGDGLQLTGLVLNCDGRRAVLRCPSLDKNTLIGNLDEARWAHCGELKLPSVRCGYYGAAQEHMLAHAAFVDAQARLDWYWAGARAVPDESREAALLTLYREVGKAREQVAVCLEVLGTSAASKQPAGLSLHDHAVALSVAAAQMGFGLDVADTKFKELRLQARANDLDGLRAALEQDPWFAGLAQARGHSRLREWHQALKASPLF